MVYSHAIQDFSLTFNHPSCLVVQIPHQDSKKGNVPRWPTCSQPSTEEWRHPPPRKGPNTTRLQDRRCRHPWAYDSIRRSMRCCGQSATHALFGHDQIPWQWRYLHRWWCALESVRARWAGERKEYQELPHVRRGSGHFDNRDHFRVEDPQSLSSLATPQPLHSMCPIQICLMMILYMRLKTNCFKPLKKMMLTMAIEWNIIGASKNV